VINIIFLTFGILFLIFFICFSILSIHENEAFAAKRSLFTGIGIFIPFLVLSIINFTYSEEVLIGIGSLFVIAIIFIILPLDYSSKITLDSPQKKIDERDIMFSRNELIPETEKFSDYYWRNPDKLSLDEKFRNEAGLLNENSFYYDKIMAESVNSIFELVESLSKNIDGQVSDKSSDIDINRVNYHLDEWAKKLGSMDIGFTELKDYHVYSIAGRGNRYGKEIKNNHKYAIAFTVEMDYDMVRGGPSFPIVMESAQQYLNAAQIAIQLATLIRNLGYSARAHIDGNYQVICPLVARDAGLGEIGRMGLLMTPKLGPRVRLGVVTTDLPLKVNEKTNLHSVIDFCTKCKKCADCCPSSSIDKNNRKEIDGILRWQINSESCFAFWCKAGSDCGRCVAVCPYSHPDNFLHNFVRWGIKRNSIFRYLAIKMDDYFYGRMPGANRIPNWLNS